MSRPGILQNLSNSRHHESSTGRVAHRIFTKFVKFPSPRVVQEFYKIRKIPVTTNRPQDFYKICVKDVQTVA